MNYTNFPTLNRRILAALQTGADFTANQLRARFGIEAVSARIAELRAAGFPIYLNTKVTDNGRSIRVYRLGTPKRSTVVAGLVAESLTSQGGYLFASEVEDAVNSRLALVQ